MPQRYSDLRTRSVASRKVKSSRRISTFRFALGSTSSSSTSATVGQSLGVTLMRSSDQNPTSSTATIETVAINYMSRGIKPYMLFHTGTMGSGTYTELPGNLQAIAARIGPGGTLYSTYPQYGGLAPEWFEIGNELFYNYRSTSAKSWAGAYATAYKSAYQAIKAGNANVKVLCPLELDAQGSTPYQTLIDNAYATVSDLHSYVDGWVFHVYGPMTNGNVTKVADILTRLGAKGAPSTIGVYFTEDGIASNGQTTTSLSPNNYGYTNPVSFDAAGAIIRQKLIDCRAHASWGSRLMLYTHYQAYDQQAIGATNQREHYFGVVQSNTTGAKGDLTQSVRDHAARY